MSKPLSNPAVAAALESVHALALLEIAKAQDQPFGHEYSTKLAAGQMGVDRHLFTLPREAFGPQADQLLNLLSGRLDLPPCWRHRLAQDWECCTHVHLGVEADARNCAWKVYFESTDGYLDALEPNPSRWRRIHRGYKWRSGQPDAMIVSRYDVLLETSPTVRQHFMAEVLGQHPPLHEAFSALLRSIPQTADGLMLLRVSDENTQRLSVDVNLYPAGQAVGELANGLRQLAQCCAVAAADFESWLNRYGSLELGHLAAGIGRDGQAFATIYCGMDEWRQ